MSLKEFAGEIDGARRLVGIDSNGLPVGCDLGTTVGPEQRVIDQQWLSPEAMPELETRGSMPWP